MFNFQIQFNPQTDAAQIEMLKQLKERGFTNKQIFAFLTGKNVRKVALSNSQKVENIILEMLQTDEKITSYTLDKAYIIQYGTSLKPQTRKEVLALYEMEILEHNNKLS